MRWPLGREVVDEVLDTVVYRRVKPLLRGKVADEPSISSAVGLDT